MKKALVPLLAALLATAASGAPAELNVAEGTIESGDGMFVGRDFEIAKDFKLELLYRPDTATEGQWVALDWDNKGRLIVPSYNSDIMVRLTIPPVGSDDPVKVEHIDTTKVGAAEGILYAFDSLYMNVNRSRTMRSGLYRLTDTNGDDKWDQTRVIRNVQGDGSDHGTHDLRLTPDGKYISVISGNATRLTEHNESKVPEDWGEDNLVIRLQQGGPGFNRAPEGWIMNYTPDGKTQQLFAMGFRNPVSHAFNKDGEMFVYDSDMEFDMGTPWYRPTNIVHVISGSDQGFRDGSRKHPWWQFDYFAPIAAVGSGSPTGSAFGTGAKFPARYQDAFFVSDWSYGNLYSVFIHPKGASYSADVERFASGRPFSVTGVIVNPADGSLLVMTTGTELYRITYTGNESTAPTQPDTRYAADRQIRHDLEQYQGKGKADSAVDTIWQYLGDQDRAIRYAARTALEWANPDLWRDRAVNETDPRKSIAAIASLARVSGKDVYFTTPETPPPDKALQRRMIAALDRIDWSMLPYQDRLDLLRAYDLTFIRLGPPDDATRQRLIAKFDPYLPAGQREMNWELAELLTYLRAPDAVPKMMALLRTAPSQPYYGIQEYINPELRVRNNPANSGPAGESNAFLAKQEDQLQYAQFLRTLKVGWTPALREEFLNWFQTLAETTRGGNTYTNAVEIIRNDAISQIPEGDRTPAIQKLIDTPLNFQSGNGNARGQ